MNFSSILDVQKLLEKMEYLKDKKNKGSVFSSEFISISKSGEYSLSYRAAIRNLDYDILLNDDSFFQFEERKEEKTTVLRYAYFENPFDTKTYDEYLSTYGFDIGEVGDEFKFDYEQEMAEVDKKDEFYPIRYDYSELNYQDGIHPCSHVHIGFSESVSIPIDKIISPLAFVFFILKTRYYQLWKIEMKKKGDFFNKYIAEKESLEKVDVKFLSANDKFDLYMT